MRMENTLRLALALRAAIPVAPALPRPLWESLLTAPNGRLSGESCALR